MAIKVAFQGVEGAYSELAAAQFFGKPVTAVACPEFIDVFQAVTKRRIPYGIVPIENSLTGSIHQNFDLMLKHRVWIAGETKLRVSHSLIALPGASFKSIRKVYSHPQALWQCQGYLSQMKNVELIPYFDTAGSVKFIRENGQKDCAAVASRQAATRYELKVLKSGIEDNKQNYTRFLILVAGEKKPTSEHCKTSILFSLKSVPGALYHSLGAFAARGLQLFKIESRPIAGRPWEYQFYLDFEGDHRSASAREALQDLKRSAKGIKVLGSYASAE